MRLVEHVGPDLIVRGRYFVDQLIIGPAVLCPIGALRLTLCTFSCDDLEHMLWEVPEGAVRQGCIGVADCMFEHCTFEGIGFAGPAATLDLIRASLTR